MYRTSDLFLKLILILIFGPFILAVLIQCIGALLAALLPWIIGAIVLAAILSGPYVVMSFRRQFPRVARQHAPASYGATRPEFIKRPRGFPPKRGDA